MKISRLFMILTLSVFLVACQDEFKKSKTEDELHVSRDSVAGNTRESATHSKTVAEIVSFIDGVFGLDGLATIDTIENWEETTAISNPDNSNQVNARKDDDEKSEANDLGTIDIDLDVKHGLKALDLSRVEHYYKYLSFEFLLFKDETSAQKQFERVAEAYRNKPRGIDERNMALFWKVFSKSGSAYILYNNMLICHDRRCNYNEDIEKPREDHLLQYLFGNNTPNNPYFVRVTCGWKKDTLK